MPPEKEPVPSKTIEEVVEGVGIYPLEAYDFVSRGLQFTVRRLHGDRPEGDERRHISGQQLCEGLREFALKQWGLMAGAVLSRWNITCTADFGRIVFAMIDGGFLSKTDEDSIDDFKNVFDFTTTFDRGYRIGSKR